MAKLINTRFICSHILALVAGSFQQVGERAQAGDNIIMKYFLSVIGMVMIVEGLPYFAFPDQIKKLLLKISETPSSQLRAMGFFLMMAGLGVLYVALKTNLIR